MKLYLIYNRVFFPFENSDMKNTKYVSGSISGELFLNDIYSEQELLEKYPEIKSYPNLYELYKALG